MIERSGRKSPGKSLMPTVLTVLGLLVALFHPAYTDLPRPTPIAGAEPTDDSSDPIAERGEAPASPEDDLDPSPTWAGECQGRLVRMRVVALSGRPDPDLAAAVAVVPISTMRGDPFGRRRGRWSKAGPTIRLCRLRC